MEIWTDGTVVVEACEHPGVVRVLRDTAVVAETMVPHLPWKTPLAVDVETDRIWVGSPLREFTLDLTPVRTHEGEVRRVVALGEGRLAAVLDGDDGVCRLVAGRPGRWEREVVLADLGEAAPGLAATDQAPSSREIRRDPTLTVSPHGIVVADGGAGVVAHFGPGLDRLGLWHSGGVDETELTGVATARGVLVTARWAARQSHLGWLTPDGPVQLRDGYGAHAWPATGDRLWLFSDLAVELLGRDGDAVASAKVPGFVRAVHAAGPRCVIAGETFLHLATATADRIDVHTLRFRDLLDVVGVFPSGAPDDFRFHSRLMSKLPAEARRSLIGGQHPRGGGPARVTVGGVRPDLAEGVAEALRAVGATSVDFDEVGLL